MQTFLQYFLIFIVYSIIGWIIESTYVSILEKKKINRGFLIGPYCPIYGLGSLIMILYLEQYKENIITVFFLAVVICSILEYTTSYLMEKIFHARWWDYSNEKFNLNGRICGKNSLLFGLGSIVVIYFAHPILHQLETNIPKTILLKFIIISLIIFTIDTIISFNIINKLKKTITTIESKKDSTQEFSKLVKETLIKSHRIFQTRLLSAFPDIELNKIKNNIKQIMKEKNYSQQVIKKPTIKKNNPNTKE